MKHEDIDRLLAELPVLAPRVVRETTPERIEGAVLAAYRGLAPRPQPQESSEVDARREQERERRRSHVRAERARLSTRLHPRLAARLSAAASPCGLLLGTTGVGKTAAMHWLAAEWPGCFAHARELASAERRHGLGEGYPPALRQARAARVLYLDDLGAEEQRDLGVLQELLDHRYRHGRATMATSGLRLAELEAHLGKAYLRRILDQHVTRGAGEWPVLLVDLFAVEARP